MTNTFMKSAKKSQKEQTTSQSAKQKLKEEKKAITIFIPVELHQKAMLHRFDTGEPMSKLIIRLMEKELN